MSFQPEVNQELVVGDTSYRIAEHPAAPGIPYGQEGRQAIVYQLEAKNGEKKALKVFKVRYRLPGLVSLADHIAPFAELPGLQVCHRTVFTPQRHATLLRQHPDLTYAVLMPWVEGPTWMEVMLEKQDLGPEQSLSLARSLAEVLSGMEEHGLAHCDLSGPNVMLPVLAPSAASDHWSSIELVDVEQLYSSDLKQPELLPGGFPGYAHKTAADGLWSSNADHFAGAVLLGEMLGWCDKRVREAAWGENYFDPQEMQQANERYRLLVHVLRERWSEGVAGLFERAWRSETLWDCPTFGEWLVMLPEPGRASEIQKAKPEADVSLFLVRGRRLEWEGDLAGALVAYRQALRQTSGRSTLREELTLIVRSLDAEVQQQEKVEEVYSPAGVCLITESGRAFPLPMGKSVIRIGRRDTKRGVFPDVDLWEVDRKRYVHRRHAKIIRKEGQWFLSAEVGAHNGTWLNKRRISAEEEVPLRDGDEIWLARQVRLTFRLRR